MEKFSYFINSVLVKAYEERSQIGGCVSLDDKVVEIFVRYGISGTSGMFIGTATPIEASILFNMRLW